ncbi:MAG TPA: TolC family protein [Pirellulales bacterium]|nr:TolC family protein [Pirellulales bacterium]
MSPTASLAPSTLETNAPARPPANEVRLARAQEQLPQGTAMPDPLNVPLEPLAPRPPSSDQVASRNWDLERLTNLALQDHPVLRRARARVAEARGAALQAGLWANPRWDTNNPQVLAVGVNNAYNAGFQTEIPVMGKKRLDREAAERLVREAQYGAQSDRYDVLQLVRQQFYAALAQQRRAEVSAELVRIAEGARDAAQRMFDAGLVAETDVLLLTLELQKAQSAFVQASTLLIGKKRQLAASVALPDLPIGDLAGELAAPPRPFDDRYVYEFVATQNVDVLSAEAEVARTRIVLRRAQVEPVPNIYSGPSQQWGVPSHSPNNQFWYNFAFNITVWDRNQGNIRAAEAGLAAATSNVPATQNQLIKQAADALGRHRAALAAADRIRANVLPTARRNQELVQRGYEGGLLPVAQVFQAQQALFQANLDYVDALDDVWSSAAELGNLLQLEEFP